jgi:hypothetical protein
MSEMIKTVFRTVILDDEAFQAWRERPNIFLRGIILIAIVTLVAGLVTFAVNFVNQVRPVTAVQIEEAIEQSLDMQRRFNPSLQDPEAQRIIDETLGVIVPMIVEISEVDIPIGRGASGFFAALGSYLSSVFASLAGWLFYGALVLVAVNLLGGSAKLPEFLGMVALYVTPGLLGLLRPIPCVGALLAFIGTIWGVVVYIKAVSFTTELDLPKSVLAVLAPIIVLVLLGILLAILFVILLVIVAR